MRCRECPIGEFATQSVIGEGPANARLMLVGEQPGDQVFVSNAMKHFKYELRGKRRIHKTPTQREAAACLHWLEDEIALQPRALVAGVSLLPNISILN